MIDSRGAYQPDAGCLGCEDAEVRYETVNGQRRVVVVRCPHHCEVPMVSEQEAISESR